MTTAPYYFYMETSNVLNSFLKYLYETVYVNTNNLINAVNASIATSDNNNDIFAGLSANIATLHGSNQSLLSNLQTNLASSDPLTDLPNLLTDLINLKANYTTILDNLKTDYYVPDLSSSSATTAIVRMSSADHNALFGITNKISETFSSISFSSQSFHGAIHGFASTILDTWVGIIADANTNAETLTYNAMDTNENVNLLQKAWQTFGATGITVAHNNANLSSLITDVQNSLTAITTTHEDLNTCLQNALSNIYDYSDSVTDPTTVV